MNKYIKKGILAIAALLTAASCYDEGKPEFYLAPSPEVIGAQGASSSSSLTINCPFPEYSNYSSGLYFSKSGESIGDRYIAEDTYNGYQVKIFDLIPNTTYYYRTFISNGEYETVSDVHSVTTDHTWVDCLGTSDITATSATLYLEMEECSFVKKCGFYISKSSTMSNKTEYVADTYPLSSRKQSMSIEGLNHSTRYYYTSFIEGDGFNETSPVYYFDTFSPTVTISTPKEITRTSVTLSLNVNDYSIPDECGFFISTYSDMSYQQKYVADTYPLIQYSYTKTISGLSSGTTYYCRAYVKVDESYIYSSTRSFTTNKQSSTYHGDLIISTQAQLNSLEAEGYSVIDGRLIIGTCYTYEVSGWRLKVTYGDDEVYYFVDNTDITDFSPLAVLTDVTGDFLLACLENLSDLNSLASYKGTGMSVYSCGNLTSLRGAASMSNIQRLYIRYCYSLSSLEGLSGSSALRTLDLQLNGISNLSTLSGLPNISTLNLHGNNISDWSSLTKFTTLKDLTVSYNNISYIPDLSPLTNLTYLKLGYASYETNTISSLSPLYNMTGLRALYLNYLPVSTSQVNTLKSYLPNCTVYSTGISGAPSLSPYISSPSECMGEPKTAVPD